LQGFEEQEIHSHFLESLSCGLARSRGAHRRLACPVTVTFAGKTLSRRLLAASNTAPVSPARSRAVFLPSCGRVLPRQGALARGGGVELACMTRAWFWFS